MGLDWLAGNKAKPGFEAEFLEMLKARRDGVSPTDEIIERFQEISLASYTQVGAPEVGVDKGADAWVRFKVRSNAMTAEEFNSAFPDGVNLAEAAFQDNQNDDEAEALEQMAGFRVLEMAPQCAGLPVYTMGAISDQVDLTSFRGKALHDCEEPLGEELLERAYTMQLPDELVEYGETLLKRAQEFAGENNCSEAAEQFEFSDWSDESAESKAHIMASAGRWCIYWGSRGHFLDAWS